MGAVTYINKTADQWTADDFRAWATGASVAGNKAGGEDAVVAAALTTLKLDAVEGETPEAFKARVAAYLSNGNESSDADVTDADDEGGESAAPTSLQSAAAEAPAPNAGSVDGPGAVVETPATPVAETSAPVAAVATPVVPVEAQAAVDTDDIPQDEAAVTTQRISAEELAKLPTYAQLIVQNLEQYAEIMAPNVAHPNGEGVAAQRSLWRTIEASLRQTGSDFTAAFGLVLDFVQAHKKDLFNEYNAMRYFDKLPLATVERKNFERLLYLILQVSDRATRQQNLKQVDLTIVLKGFPNDVQQRLTQFFQI